MCTGFGLDGRYACGFFTLKFTISAPQTLGCASRVSFDAANDSGLHTRAARLPSPRVGEFGFEPPTAHNPASRGGTDPFGPQTLGRASRASFDAASARGSRFTHAPLAHTPASREVVHVRNWEPCPLFPIISQNCVGSKTELVETPSCLVWLKNYSEAYPRLSCIIHQAHPRHVPLRATRPSMSFRKIGGANACAKPCAQSTHTRWQYVNRHYLGMSCAE